MTELFSTMAPIFGLIVLGFAAVRVGVIDRGGVRGLVLFVFTFAIPALLIRSVADLRLPTEVDWGFLIAFYAGSFGAYAVGMAVGRLGFGQPPPEEAIFGMVGSYSNLVMMGLPIVLVSLGEEAILWLMLVIAFHSVTFMPFTILLMQRGGGADGPPARRALTVALEVGRNPIVVGILIGTAINLSGLEVGGAFGTGLGWLGEAAIPCALFAMGGSLAGYPLTGALGPAGVLTLTKLVVHPALVWLVGVPLLGLSGLPITVAVLLAAMPSAVNSYLFGARYDVAADVAARTVLLTTVGSAVTISVLLWLMT